MEGLAFARYTRASAPGAAMDCFSLTIHIHIHINVVYAAG